MFKIIIFVGSLLIFQSEALSQGPPPTMAMATKDNQVLIDEIIEITKFKEQYAWLCTSFIERKAAEKGWDTQEIEKRKSRMDAERFIRMNFYNFMESFSTKELQDIISFLKKANHKTSYHPFFLSNSSIENNLIIHIMDLIE